MAEYKVACDLSRLNSVPVQRLSGTAGKQDECKCEDEVQDEILSNTHADTHIYTHTYIDTVCYDYLLFSLLFLSVPCAFS